MGHPQLWLDILPPKGGPPAGAACWGQSLTYDRYANLYQIGATKCNAPALSLLPPSATTNRFVDSGFAYDTVGNMTNDGPPLNTAYTYNAENQMKTEGATTMTYDGDGLRVKKSNGKLSWRMPGGGPFIATTDASGGTVKDMIFFAGRLVAERTVTGGVVNYYLGDQLASSIKLTNQTGTTCWDADYYPFGGANIFTTTCQPMYRFAQLESKSDTSTDMDYAMFRYYDHRFVRFMSADPIGGNLGNPQTLNRYAYVGNSPTIAVDPLGLDSVGCVGKRWVCPDPNSAGGDPFAMLGGTEYCLLSGLDAPCGLVHWLVGIGGADYCGLLPVCGPINISGAGWATPSFGNDGSINWSFSFPTLYAGVELSNAALAEALSLYQTGSAFTRTAPDIFVLASQGPQTPQPPQKNGQPPKQQKQQQEQPSKLAKFCGNWSLVNGSWTAFNLGLATYAVIPEPAEPALFTAAFISGTANGIFGAAQWVVCP